MYLIEISFRVVKISNVENENLWQINLLQESFRCGKSDLNFLQHLWLEERLIVVRDTLYTMCLEIHESVDVDRYESAQSTRNPGVDAASRDYRWSDSGCNAL